MRKKVKNTSEIPDKSYYDKIKMPKDFLNDETTSPEWQEKIERKENQTSSKKKMWNYVKDLTERSAFRNDLKSFRKKFKIHEDGYDNIVYKKSILSGEMVYVYPNHSEIENQKGYRDDLISFARKYKLSVFWVDALEDYIFYNKFISETMGSMIDIEDVASYFHGNYQYPGEEESMKEYFIDKTKQFPVAIFLNPYVSQRDIIDYVKKMFRLSIEPKLKEYREENIKLGKVRRKNSRVEVRDKFIFDNREKPTKEITSLVAKNFGDILDYTYIARIIKEQKRIRK